MAQDLHLNSTVPSLADLLAYFLYLEHSYRHCRPQDTKAYRTAFQLAQEELWILAQGICGYTEPATQQALDQTRREIMHEIRAQLKTGHYTISQAPKPRPTFWYEFELTPEVSHDTRLVGTLITRQLAKNLRRLLRQQSICVRSVLERNRAHFKN